MRNGLARPVIGVTMGDAAGVGAEITVKAISEGALKGEAATILIGDRRQLEQGIRVTGKRITYGVEDAIEKAAETAVKNDLVLLDTKNLNADEIAYGTVSAACGKNSAETMVLAARYCQEGFLDGFCFGPNNKVSMKKAGYNFSGMVDILAQSFEHHGACGELNVVDDVFNARVTGHIPMREVADALSTEKILETIKLSHEGLRRFGIDAPKIAVAALNPHGGENGECGTEEIDIIAPAIEIARSEGMDVSGPFAADTLFTRLFKRQFDVAVTMYHDQGQIAVKLKDFDNGVTFYAGLPFPVTTCAHGPAYGRAGKGTASPYAFIAAYQFVAKAVLSANRSVS